MRESFSSPLWGFFYLIPATANFDFQDKVLVPSLGILLFNEVQDYGKDRTFS